MRKALVARSNHDDGTCYLFEWSGLIIKEAESNGFQVSDVRGEDVNSRELVGKIKSAKPSFVFLNGHGSKDAFCGHNFVRVIDIANADVLSGTITYVRACECLEMLGEEAVKKGCNAFIGYRMAFMVPMQDEYVSRPLQDPMAKPVMEASNRVATSIIHCNTAEEAVESSHKLARKHIAEILFSKKYSQDIYSNPTLEALVINDRGLGFLGNKDAKIS